MGEGLIAAPLSLIRIKETPGGRRDPLPTIIRERPMPQDVAILVSLITAAFVIFAVVLAAVDLYDNAKRR